MKISFDLVTVFRLLQVRESYILNHALLAKKFKQARFMVGPHQQVVRYGKRFANTMSFACMKRLRTISNNFLPISYYLHTGEFCGKSPGAAPVLDNVGTQPYKQMFIVKLLNAFLKSSFDSLPFSFLFSFPWQVNCILFLVCINQDLHSVPYTLLLYNIFFISWVIFSFLFTIDQF